MAVSAFSVDFEVRDNELDVQGIVNNSNYYIYLEHARHKWLRTRGINFSEWSQKGLKLIVLSAELEFKKALRSHQQFYVTCALDELKSRVRFSVSQEIHLSTTNEIMVSANIVGTCINENAPTLKERFFIPDELSADMSAV